ncbi:efflux RND transporter periplasmic adaptor subunit [Amylibacter sp. SFDW26]|uniref:efflux RND transporter periplasmic adaptor subunit n=1 Tax=Amylibacter sp. SFDW26 TaxID=2652722 RepID=UPI0012624623|nr:efflux RND transporter periplasmic adaptor subunit [Amylibacter sp. SFDW26]KAB7616238.1 efflux RND transporter periplasmic adaptor subunit [Amylibacter sp. SFDW26]
MRPVPIILALLVCAAIATFVIKGGNSAAPKEDTPESSPAIAGEFPPVSVLVQKSVAQPVTSGIVLRGQTEAFRQLEVRAEVDGKVISQPLRKGTLVTEGQLLCELDVGTRQAAIAEAKARYEEAKANNKGAAGLVQKGIISETAAFSREAALEAAQANLDRAQREYNNLKINAPFSGLLESDTSEFGSFIQRGSPCATVLQLNPMKLVGFATEEQVARITENAQAGARLLSGRQVEGKVTFISRRADSVTRTFRVEITVPNDDGKLRDGSTADIYIALSGEKGHIIPQSALTLNGDGILGIRAVKDNKATFLPIEVIRDSAEGIWVSGLPAETNVIVVGQEYVTDGREVSVTFKEES